MKTFDAAKIRDIAGKLSQWAMLAAMVTLCISFFRAYMAAAVWFYTLTVKPLFNCTYARKRVINRIVHHRKFAVFAGNPDSRAGLSGKW
jgi:hypothetical protein